MDVINKKELKNEGIINDQYTIDPNVLLQVMVKNAWSKKDLQRESGISVVTINKMLRGESVRPATIGKIVNNLNIPLENLIRGNDDSKEE